MLRRLLAAHPEPLPFAAIRNWSRRERERGWIASVVAAGLIEALPDDRYRLTDRGIAACELGQYESEPAE